MSRYALISKEWMLRGWTDVPYAMVSRFRPLLHLLSEEEFYVISSCDGNSDFDGLAFTPKHHRILERMIQEKFVMQCEQGAVLEELQKYHRAANRRVTSILCSITGKCNYNCRHCYMIAPSGKIPQMSHEQLWKMIDELAAANVCEIAVTGGELLLREDFLEMLSYLYEKGICLSAIFTNASKIDITLLKTLERYHMKPVFRISFDGYGTHDYMRGMEGAQQMTIDGIRLLKQHGYPVIIISSVDQEVLKTMDATFDCLRDMEIDHWWIGAPIEVGNWKETTSAVDIRAFADALEHILIRWEAEGRPFEMKLWMFGRYLTPDQGRFRLKTDMSITGESYNCEACHLFPCIDPYGHLVPCASYLATVVADRMPDIFSIGLAAALEDSEFRHLSDLRKREVLEHNPSCAFCSYFHECGSGCRSAALSESGDYMMRNKSTCMAFHGGYMKRFDELSEKLEQKWRKEHE